MDEPSSNMLLSIRVNLLHILRKLLSTMTYKNELLKNWNMASCTRGIFALSFVRVMNNERNYDFSIVMSSFSISPVL